MSQGYVSDSRLQRRRSRYKGINVAASGTEYTDPFGITPAGSKYMRIDIVLGRIEFNATGLTMELEDSANPQLGWNDLASTESALKKTVSADSTNKNITSVAANVITSAAHGYSDGDAIGVTGTTVPTGLSNEKIYYVINKATNTLQLTSVYNDPHHIVSIDDKGTAAVMTAISTQSLRINVNDPTANEGEDVLPLRPNGRIKFTAGAGESLQVLDVIVMQDIG